MTTEARLASRLGWALVGLGAALVIGGVAWRGLARTPPPDLGPPSQQARARVEQALASRARALEPKAAEAARVAELGAALNMGADQDTFQDLLESEDWWAPFRSAFPLSAVVAGGKPLAVIGPGAGALGANPLVREAREKGSASGTLPGHGRAFLAGAARVSRSKRPNEAPVVVLGTVLDQAALAELAGATGDAVGLSDRTRLVEAAGAGEPRRALMALLGREDRGPLLLPDGRVGAGWALGGDLWMLTATAAPPPEPPPAQRTGLFTAIGGAALAFLGLLIVGVGRGRGARAAVQPPLSDPARRRAAEGVPASPAGALPVAPAAAFPPARYPSTVRLAADSDPSADGHSPTMAADVALSADAAPQDGGVQLGRYRLLDRIGEGGMAEIFFAAAYGAEDFVRHFVVKRMHPHLSRSRELVNQFIDEARLQAGLVHSNIVPLFDFGKAGDEYYLALEYIHGQDVTHLLQRHIDQLGQPLPLPIAFYIAHEVLEALAFAHSQTTKDGRPLDIVHRDVAPGNVLVSYRGEVKLTDFGIAKAEKRVSRTEVGMVKGNASFMSPEQARGETVDRRSDVFSCGLVLFYCLTGQLLYKGETTLNRLLRAAVGPATSQFSQIERLPLPAAKVLRRALALDPSQRYGSASEFQRDVTPHVAGRTDLAALMDQLFPPAERGERAG
jgi:hypothetical protein